MRRAGWLVSGALLACGLTAGSRAENPGGMVALDIGGFSGEQVFARICQGCHMPQGQGAEGAGHYPKLAGDPALASWQLVALTVMRGRNGMPAFAPADPDDVEYKGMVPQLSDAQVADVVNYVRSHLGNHYRGQVTAAQVAALRRTLVPK